MPAAPKQKSKGAGGKRFEYQDKEKPTQIRFSNINAAKGLFTSFVEMICNICLACFLGYNFKFRISVFIRESMS